MEINANKTKLMTNSDNGIQHDITVNEEKLETVKKFKYLRAIISDEGSKPEVIARIAMTAATLIKVDIIWKDTAIKLSSKIKLMRSLVNSFFFMRVKHAELEKRAELEKSRVREKSPGFRNEMFQEIARHLIKKLHHQ